MPLKPGSTLGKYRIERELGRGGMGVVFLAYDTTLERQLAIKVLGAPSESDASHTTAAAGGAQRLRAQSPEHLHGLRGRRSTAAGRSSRWSTSTAVRRAICRRPVRSRCRTRAAIRHRGRRRARARARSRRRASRPEGGQRHRLVERPSEARGFRAGPASRYVASGRHDASLAWGAAVPLRHAVRDGAGAAAGRRGRRARGYLGTRRAAARDAGRERARSTDARLRNCSRPSCAIRRRSLPPHVSEPLREVVQRCLAKDPAERYQRAADVRLVLEAIASGLSVVTRHSRSDSRIGSASASRRRSSERADGGSLRRPRARARADGRGVDAREQRPAPGAPARRRTGHRQDHAWRSEFARGCAEEGATVLVGRSDEEALVPYQPFVEALGWYVRVCPERGSARAPGGHRRRRRAGDLDPGVAAAGSGYSRSQPAMSPDGTALSAVRSRQPGCLLGGIDRAPGARRVRRPALGRQADPAHAEARHARVQPASLCIVGTYRESELGRTHPLAEMLADLRREQAVTRLSLRGLDEARGQGT